MADDDRPASSTPPEPKADTARVSSPPSAGAEAPPADSEPHDPAVGDADIGSDATAGGDPIAGAFDLGQFEGLDGRAEGRAGDLFAAEASASGAAARMVREAVFGSPERGRLAQLAAGGLGSAFARDAAGLGALERALGGAVGPSLHAKSLAALAGGGIHQDLLKHTAEQGVAAKALGGGLLGGDIARGVAATAFARAKTGSVADLLRDQSIGESVADRFLRDERERTRRLDVGGLFGDRAALRAWAEPIGGGAIAKWAGLHSPGRDLAETLRSQRWAEGVLNGGTLASLAGTPGFGKGIAAELDRVAAVADGLLGGTRGRGASAQLDTMLAAQGKLAATASKMSAFAGILDVVGPGQASVAAYADMLGDWQTRADLPAAFWRNPAERARRYREAEVDPGLVDTANADLVELLVETGVVEGETRNGRVTAVVEAGPLRVRISAARPRQGAGRVLGAFELGLRGFVEMKLRAAMAAAGEDPDAWFPQRLPGDVVKRIRDRRREALAAGEPEASPIAYVDLGDFIPIVTQRQNWKIFEPVFGNADAFKVDMARLNAIRRPVAHLRVVDPVQLVETTFTVSRLTKAITMIGGWDQPWDDAG